MSIIVKVVVMMLLVLSYVGNGFSIEVESIKEVASYVLTPDMGVDYYYPRFSPDGTKIAASSDKGLIIMDSDGGNIGILRDKGRFRIPKWSPDSSKIAFESRSSTGKGSSIWIVNRDGSNVYELTKGSNDIRPVWSPDGTKIAFYKVIEGKGSIWTINIDGSNLRKISPEAEDFSHPLFTPDGTKIICIKRWIGDGSPAIWIMNIDGSNFREVKKEYNFSPDRGGGLWALDGNRIWSGSSALNITNGFSEEGSKGGILSYDWKWICYEDVKSGNKLREIAMDSQLYIMGFYGANNIQITNEPDIVYEAQDWSRDGKMLLATKENNPEKVEYTRPRIVVVKLRY